MNMMMQVQLKQEPQEPGLKPPDEASAVHNSTIASAARLAGEKRPKVSSGGSSNSSGSMNADQAQKCPRCDSLNTKFCYYNNYSLSQPRHFCKNCRRYWTKGGALRNVPVGGGCRKNKRIRQQTRSLDPNSYDESPSNILANISSNGSMSGAPTCTPLLPCFGGPSTSGFSDMANENQASFGFTFSRLQESMRTGEQSGAVPSSQPNLFGLVPTSASLLGAQPTSALLNMPSFHPATYPAVTFDPSPTIKAEPGGLLYHGSELSTYLVDNAAQASNPVAMAPSTAIVPKLEDHLSSFSGSTSDSGSMEKLHHNSLALHNVVGHPEQQGIGEEHCGLSCNRNVQGFEEETSDGLINRRSLPMSFMKGKPFGEWQGAGAMAGEIMFGSASEASLWNASWPEMHAALAGTTMAGALLH